MIKRLIQYLILAILSGLIVLGIIWANEQAKNDVCRDVVIEIEGANSIHFVSDTVIQRELKKAKFEFIGKKITDINTYEVEQMLSKIDYIEDVYCYISKANNLVIVASQITPVLRVFDGNNSYYVNKNGKRVATDYRFFLDLPIVKGDFSETLSPLVVLPIVNKVASDKTLSELISMYEVKNATNIMLVPTIGGHIISFGDNTNLDNKFKKLEQFYKEVMPIKGWQYYDTISLKWNHQVVAHKRIATKRAEIEYVAEEDEQAPDISTITNANNAGTRPTKSDLDSVTNRN